MSTVKIILENGAVIEGTEDQVLSICNALGHSIPRYNSSTKGLIPIYSMATPHIINALLLEYKKWLENLKGLSVVDLLDALKYGAGYYNPTIVHLAKELTNRADTGKL